MSRRPGTTSLPRASIMSAASAEMLGAIAAMRPLAIATSRTASSLAAGSMTRPPLTIRSKRLDWAARETAADASAAPVAAMNSRRVTKCANRSATVQLLFRVYHACRIDDGAPAHLHVPILEARARPVNDDRRVDIFDQLRDLLVLGFEEQDAYALRPPRLVNHRRTSARQP